MEQKRPNHRPHKTLKISQVLNEDFYTIEEASKMFKVHHTTIRRAIKQGRLKAFKFGKKWLISKDTLNDLK